MALVVGTNSYASNAEADDYLSDHVDVATWLAWDRIEQDRYLVTAARMIDRQVWQGTKYQQAPTQVMDWPRSGLTNEEDQAIDETTIPQFVKDAQCELTIAIGKDSAVQTERNTGSNIKRMKAGSAELELFGTRTTGTRFPVIIHELLGLYG